MSGASEVPLAEVIDLTMTDDAPVEQPSVTESVSASEVAVDPAAGVAGDFGSDGPRSSSAPQGAAPPGALWIIPFVAKQVRSLATLFGLLCRAMRPFWLESDFSVFLPSQPYEGRL